MHLANKRKRRRGGQRRPPPPQRRPERRGGGAKRRAAVRSAPSGRRGSPDSERPPAPWGSFPLVELVTLVGLVLLVLGFLVVKGDRGAVMIAVGVLLAALAGLELSIREHIAGYRSHTLLLAAVAGAAVLAALFYLAPESVPIAVRLLIAGIVFAGSARILSLAFQRRAGVLYKLR